MKKSNLFRRVHTRIAVALILVSAIVLLAGCGGKVDERFAGKWKAIKTTASGVTMSPSEVFKEGFTLEFVSGNKVKIFVDGEEGTGKWSVDGDKVTINEGSEEWQGTIDGDFLEFKNASNTGVDIVFGREGTDAMDPMHSLSESEKKLVGTWNGESVVDVLGQPVQVEGVAAADVLKLTFQPDRVLNVVHKGENVGDTSWTLIDNWDAPDAIGDLSIMYEIQDDGKMNVDVSSGDEFLYTVTCVKTQ